MRSNITARLVAVALGLLGLALDQRLPAADPPKTGDGTLQRVMRMVTVVGEGANVYYLVVTAPEGGPPIRLLLTEEARKKHPGFIDPGELVTVTVKPAAAAAGTDFVTAIAEFDGPRGLKSPKAFIYEGLGEQKTGTQTLTTARLSRFGQTTEVIIPNRPAPGGKPAADPALLEKLSGFKTGDVIEIEVQAAGSRGAFNLLDIDAYREPQLGEFIKLDTIKEGNRSIPAVALNVDDQSQIIALPVAVAGSSPKPSEAAVQAMVRKFKPGNYVRFTARDVAGRSTLRDVRIDGTMEPSSDKNHEFLSTFIRIQFYAYGAETEVYFYPRSGRPDDQLLEKGLRRVIYSASEARRLGLSDVQVQQLKTSINDRFQPTDSDALAVKQKNMWVKAYNARSAARTDAERMRVEEQMAFAAQDFSARWKREIEAKYTIMKSFLDAKQLEEVRKLGRKASGSAD